MRQFETLDAIDRALDTPRALDDVAVLRDVLQTAGLPFDRPLSELGEPKPEPYGLGVLEFEFPNVEVFGLPAATWRHRAHRPETAWTHEFEARFWVHPEIEPNFAAVCATLAVRLGPIPPVAPGALATWGTPLLEIRARCEPPLRGPQTNPRLRDHPELTTCTTVDLYSTLRTTAPDGRILEQVAAGQPLPVQALQPRGTRTFQRLHPEPLPDTLRGVWLDEAVLAISARHLTIAYPRTAPLVLDLTEVQPARGPGSSKLELACGSGSVTVAEHRDPSGLRVRAAQLAALLGVPIRRTELAND